MKKVLGKKTLQVATGLATDVAEQELEKSHFQHALKCQLALRLRLSHYTHYT